MKTEDAQLLIDENPLFRKIVLKRPEEFAPETRPTVSLHLLVKNGESCVGRLLRNVGPYIDEIVAVVNDTTDKTEEILRSYAEERKQQQPSFNLIILPVTAETHPDLYILDVPETYEVGQPMVGEVYEGPFTGKPLLADWAGIRNLGWTQATKQWRLFLDADDVVLDPESIPGLCLALDEAQVDLACSRYIYSSSSSVDVSVDNKEDSKADSYRERLCKNEPYIAWYGITHEVIKGQQRTAHIDGNLIVRDMKDSSGAGIRSPGRCFKILYRHARMNDWMISPRNLLYLAMEVQFKLPALAIAVLDKYMDCSLWPEERAWACSMRGEIHEKVEEDYELASSWYERSLREHPGTKAAFRLCRSRFHAGKWQEAIDAFQMGVENKVVMQLLDNGPVFEDMSKILVAAALAELGRTNEAKTMCSEALKSFPHNAALKALHDKLSDGS